MTVVDQLVIPERYRKAPDGYPDLILLQAIEDQCGLPQRDLVAHVSMLKEAGTLTRTYHTLLRITGFMPNLGGPEILDPAVMVAIKERALNHEFDGDVDQYIDYWSDAVH